MWRGLLGARLSALSGDRMVDFPAPGIPPDNLPNRIDLPRTCRVPTADNRYYPPLLWMDPSLPRTQEPPMRPYASLSFVPLLALFAACGPKPPREPEFFTKPPKESGKIFGSGEATKQSPQLAKEIADQRACAEIAATIGRRFEAIAKDHLQQSGQGDGAEADEFTSSTKKILVDQRLADCEILQRETRRGEKETTVFSLAVAPKASAMATIHSSLEAMRSKVSARIAFDELERTIEEKIDR